MREKCLRKLEQKYLGKPEQGEATGNGSKRKYLGKPEQAEVPGELMQVEMPDKRALPIFKVSYGFAHLKEFGCFT